jgi:3-oxoacid CoA-transferase subunit A
METAERLNVPKLRNVEEAVELIQSGQTIHVGGFGISGTPLTLLEAITHHPVKDLTVVSNNLGEKGRGLGILLDSGQLKKAIGSYFTTNADAVKAWQEGKLEIELIPQGTLAEAIRAAGAGIPAFYTPTAVGTLLAEGKEEREFDGKRYILQRSLKADVAIIKAHKADELGNLTYWKTARAFNPVMATAADLVIAEVDEIVPVGSLAIEEIVTPHLYVDILVLKRHKGGERHEEK